MQILLKLYTTHWIFVKRSGVNGQQRVVYGTCMTGSNGLTTSYGILCARGFKKCALLSSREPCVSHQRRASQAVGRTFKLLIGDNALEG